MLEVYTNSQANSIIRYAELRLSAILGKEIKLLPQDALDITPSKELQKQDYELREAICSVCDVYWVNVISKSRLREFVLPRQLYCVYAKKHLGYSAKYIGRILGRDHSTVLHSLKTVNKLIAVNDDLYKGKMDLINKILGK